MDELIWKQDAIDELDEQIEYCNKALSSFDISAKDKYAVEAERASLKAYREQLENLPSAQLDEKLEKCRFEYINACRTVTFPTPDTTKKDISDAYAVIKVLQPIFSDVSF